MTIKCVMTLILKQKNQTGEYLKRDRVKPVARDRITQ